MFNPSITKGFGTHIRYRGGGGGGGGASGDLLRYLMTPLTEDREIFVRNRFILECFIKDKVGQIFRFVTMETMIFSKKNVTENSL